MNILLINPKVDTYYPQPPLGLLSLGTVLNKLGHKVKIYDMSATKVNGGTLNRYAQEASLIGITATSLTYRKAVELAAFLRGYLPDKQMIIGGVQASITPQAILDLDIFDAVVVGESDNEQYLQDIVCHLKHNTIYSTDEYVDIDNLPIMNYELINNYTYRSMPPHGMFGRVMPMLTSRGCPYNCTFCSKAVFGNKYRSQSPTRIVEEIRHLQTLGINEIAFYDDVFTINHKNTYELMELLKPLGIKWTCQTRVNLVTNMLLKAMKQAGCFAIAYGLESGAPEVLRSICKDIEVEKAQEAVKLTQEAGIKVIGYFMFGSPGETEQTIKQTIKWATKLNPDYAQFSITLPLPGSVLFQQRQFDTYALGYLSNGLCDIDIIKLAQSISTAYKKFYLRPSYIVRQALRCLKSWSELKSTLLGLRLFFRR